MLCCFVKMEGNSNRNGSHVLTLNFWTLFYSLSFYLLRVYPKQNKTKEKEILSLSAFGCNDISNKLIPPALITVGPSLSLPLLYTHPTPIFPCLFSLFLPPYKPHFILSSQKLIPRLCYSLLLFLLLSVDKNLKCFGLTHMDFSKILYASVFLTKI